MSDFWHVETHVTELKELWAAGMSASQIALSLRHQHPGYDGQPSRNSVLSKIHRMNMSNTRPSTVRAPATPRKPREPRVRLADGSLPPSMPQPEIDVEPIVLEDGSFVTVLTVNDRMCRWPIGDPIEDDFHFCGHKPAEGVPYCAPHWRKAHETARAA